MSKFKNKGRNFVKKGWGYEKWLVNKPEYCGKLLFFEQGKKCSFHKHELKDEVFYIYEGKLKVWWSFDDEIPIEEGEFENKGIEILNPDDTFYVPTGMRHQMLGIEDTVMFEFSTQHFDEDSIRIKKGD